MPDIIHDAQGNERRCGSLPVPENRVSALPPFAGEPNQPLWSDEEIKSVVTDASRVPARELFDAKWISDQLATSACNGHAIAAAGARARFRRGVRDGLLFSGAYSYSKMNRGSDNGSVILDDIAVAQNFGFCPADLVTTNMIYPKLQPAGVDAEAAKHKGIEVYQFVGDFATKMRALRTALAVGLPCVCAVMAGDEWSKLDAAGVSGVVRGIGNHACCLDDLKWDGKRWLYNLANSWDDDWGQDGCAYMIDEHFKQTHGPHAFVAIGSFDELG